MNYKQVFSFIHPAKITSFDLHTHLNAAVIFGNAGIVHAHLFASLVHRFSRSDFSTERGFFSLNYFFIGVLFLDTSL